MRNGAYDLLEEKLHGSRLDATRWEAQVAQVKQERDDSERRRLVAIAGWNTMETDRNRIADELTDLRDRHAKTQAVLAETCAKLNAAQGELAELRKYAIPSWPAKAAPPTQPQVGPSPRRVATERLSVASTMDPFHQRCIADAIAAAIDADRAGR